VADEGSESDRCGEPEYMEIEGEIETAALMLTDAGGTPSDGGNYERRQLN
jgi:hypothetical protein